MSDWLYWAMLAAAVLHVVEEYTTGFLAWFRRAIPSLAPGMTPLWALVINGLFLACCATAAIMDTWPATVRLIVPGVLFINALLHIAMTLRMREYSPGLVTACVLYVPLAGLAYAHASTAAGVDIPWLALSLVASLLVHAVAPLSLRLRARAGGPRTG